MPHWLIRTRKQLVNMTGRRSEYFIKGVDYSWHKGPELTQAAKQFHDRYLYGRPSMIEEVRLSLGKPDQINEGQQINVGFNEESIIQ